MPTQPHPLILQRPPAINTQPGMTHHPAPIRSDEGPPPPPPPLPPGRSPTIRRSPPVRPAPAAQVARNGRAQYGGGGPWGARQTQTGRQKQTGRQAHDARRRGAWTRFRRRGGLGCRRYAGLLSTRRAPSCGQESGSGQRLMHGRDMSIGPADPSHAVPLVACTASRKMPPGPIALPGNEAIELAFRVCAHTGPAPCLVCQSRADRP